MAAVDCTPDPISVAHFWSRVDVGANSKCWPWRGGVSPAKYGSLKFSGETWLAHRVAYTLVWGPLAPGEIVRHTCDTPLCCNPQHLLSGTHQANVRDRVLRGRSARGARNGRARLDENAVSQIRSSALSNKQLAEQFGVTPHTIDAVKRRRSWGHVG